MRKKLLFTLLLLTLLSCSNDNELTNATTECNEINETKIIIENTSTTTCESSYIFSSDSFSNLKYEWYINNKRIENLTTDSSSLSYTFTENGSYEICMKPIVENGNCTLQKKCTTLNIENLTIGTVKDVEDYLTGLNGPIEPILKGNELYFVEFLSLKVSKVNITEASPIVKEVISLPKSTDQFSPFIISALAFRGDYLYLAVSSTTSVPAKIYKVDVTVDLPKAEEIITLPKEIDPTDLAFKGNELYISTVNKTINSNQNSIYKADITSSEIKTNVVFTHSLALNAIAIKGDELFMILRPNLFSGGQLSKINLKETSPRLTDVISQLSIPRRIKFIGNELYLLDFGSKKIVKVDLNNNTTTDIISGLPNSFTGFAFSGNAIYATESFRRKIVKATLECKTL